MTEHHKTRQDPHSTESSSRSNASNRAKSLYQERSKKLSCCLLRGARAWNMLRGTARHRDGMHSGS